MEKIASFTVDHTKLRPGMYLSRRDGDIVTYDLRFKRPNIGDLLSNAQMHSLEHIFATLLRNSDKKDGIIYFGPMGCQTGFYLLVDGRVIDHAAAIRLVRQVCEEGANFNGPMPGKSERECGNYRNLDVDLARELAAYFRVILKNWTVERLSYEG